MPRVTATHVKFKWNVFMCERRKEAYVPLVNIKVELVLATLIFRCSIYVYMCSTVNYFLCLLIDIYEVTNDALAVHLYELHHVTSIRHTLAEDISTLN